MQIVEHDDADAIVTPTAVAGIVSFDITNPTDGYRCVEIQPDAARRHDRGGARGGRVEFARSGTVDTSDILSEPVLGVSIGPHDHFVTAMPLEAGEYAVLLTTGDSTFADAPDADGHEVRQLTITAGNAGAAPAPTMAFDRMAEDYLIGPILATPGTQTIRVDNTAEARSSWRSRSSGRTRRSTSTTCGSKGSGGVDPIDWSTAPIATFLVFYAGAAEQTVTVDLGGGDVATRRPPVVRRRRSVLRRLGHRRMSSVVEPLAHASASDQTFSPGRSLACSSQEVSWSSSRSSSS